MAEDLERDYGLSVSGQARLTGKREQSHEELEE
jgi:hypothetical protein